MTRHDCITDHPIWRLDCITNCATTRCDWITHHAIRIPYYISWLFSKSMSISLSLYVQVAYLVQTLIGPRKPPDHERLLMGWRISMHGHPNWPCAWVSLWCLWWAWAASHIILTHMQASGPEDEMVSELSHWGKLMPYLYGLVKDCFGHFYKHRLTVIPLRTMTCRGKCAMKLLIHSQTSRLNPWSLGMDK